MAYYGEFYNNLERWARFKAAQQGMDPNELDTLLEDVDIGRTDLAAKIVKVFGDLPSDKEIEESKKTDIYHELIQADMMAVGEDKLTPRVREVMTLARKAVAQRGHDYLGTEHLLIAVATSKDSVAQRVLASSGRDGSKILDSINFIIGEGWVGSRGGIVDSPVITPRAKKAIGFAAEESLRMNDNFIGTHHLLLGLIREGDGIAYRILEPIGGDPNMLANFRMHTENSVQRIKTG